MKKTTSQCFIMASMMLFSSSVFSGGNALIGAENQITISAGQSVRSGFDRENLYMGSIVYSQPSTFFRIPAKLNIEGIYVKGKDASADKQVGDNLYPRDLRLSDYDMGIFGISQDVQLFNINGFYSSIGLGGYLKSESTDRISSKFTFGEKITVGYQFNNTVNLELYARHFSNGSLTDKNAGQNFYGLSLGYSF
ncbi:acyloxyacyl hydrolase [Vibrio cholerae]|nr:acyloxyacyl hydrolase [Vibrio cholerae]HDZ9325809.1 acyloxyacyl hydrolase [Vibrio cholerae]